MEQNTLAKQNILTFGWFLSLTTLIISALTLCFDVISQKFGATPSIIAQDVAGFESTSSSLDSRIFMVYIIIFSILFIFLTYKNIKKIDIAPDEVKNNSLRIFLAYTLLYFSCFFILTSVVSLLYKLLGSEFIRTEVYQELLVLAVSSVIFFCEFVTRSHKPGRFSYKQMTIACSAFVLLLSLGSVLLTLVVIGSPVEIRKQAQDKLVTSELPVLQDAVVSYLQDYKAMPKSLEETKLSYYDSLENQPIDYSKYQYRVITDPIIVSDSYTNGSFEICAIFNTAKQNKVDSKNNKLVETNTESSYWNHSVGKNCYTFTPSADEYPFANY
jgi:hypothetical protein